MNQKTSDQARGLLNTIMQLQRRVVMRTTRNRFNGAPSASELSMPQMLTLRVIREQREMSIKEIAHASDVSPPSASAMVERLVDMGMLTRETSPSDRRGVRISITQEGEETLNLIEGELLNALMEIMESIGVEPTRKWCEVYDRIQQYLDEDTRAVAHKDFVEGVH